MLHADVCLESVAYHLPAEVVSTESTFEELAPMLERLRIPIEGVMAASGVEERRFWPRGTSIAETAARAAAKALDASGLTAADIGCVISTSVCKDYIEPSMASLVHGRLGLPSHCLNFDIGNACLAFLNGMSVLADMIDQGRIKAALIVDSESARDVIEATVARLLSESTTVDDFRDNFAALTLGSGAVAAVLTHRSISKKKHRVIGHVAMADTRHSSLCLGQPHEMIVHARPLMEAGVNLAKRTWSEAERVFGWTPDVIDLFVGHQVGKRHQQFLFESLNLDPNRAFVTYPFLGNVGPASVPLTLALAEERGRLKGGERIALMGIGSGLNCSMMEIQW